VKKKLGLCIVHIVNGDGFSQLGLCPFKPVNCFVKLLAAMVTMKPSLENHQVEKWMQMLSS
jgi:hypothetical protein